MKDNQMWECSDCGKIEYGKHPPQECEECWKMNSFIQVEEDELEQKREANVVEEIRPEFEEGEYD